MTTKKSNLIHVIVLMIIAIAGSLFYSSERGGMLPQDDPIHYLAAAYNIAKYGVFSRTRVDEADKVEPKYRREPLYPFVLATGLKSLTVVDAYSLDCLLHDRDCSAQRDILVMVNRGLLLLLYVAIGLAGWQLTRRWSGGYIAVLLMLAGNYYGPVAGQWVFYPEILAALLMSIHSVALFQAMSLKNGAVVWAVASGIGLGLLILTKAIFQFWLVLLILSWIVAFLLMLRGKVGPQVLRNLGLIVLCGSLVAGGWATRNLVHFGHFAISERAGNILLLRSMFALMTDLEYRAAYCHWTPGELVPLKRLLCEGVPREAFARLGTDGSDPGTFKGMRNEQLEVFDEVSDDEGSRERSKIGTGVKSLLADWDEQAKLIPLFAYRGSWPDIRSIKVPGAWKVTIVEKARSWVYTIGQYTSLLLMPALILLAILSLFRRRWLMLLFLLPSLYGVGIHAVATHFLPRYNLPALPVMAIAVAVLLLAMGSRSRNQTAQSTIEQDPAHSSHTAPQRTGQWRNKESPQ